MSKTKTSSLCKVVESEACKLLGGEVQQRIIGLLRSEELPICTIAEKLNMTPQAIYHHIKKLEKAGLVHVTREERCGHLIQSYYQATAKNFISSTSEPDSKYQVSAQEGLRAILEGLDKIGFKIEAKEENLLKLAEIQKSRRKFTKLRSPVNEICSKCGSGDFFFKSGPMDPLKLDHIYHYANLLMLTDEEYEERLNNERKLREFLLSICQEKPTT
jgi:DNA-binding transcriptional ArsR family regulator